MMVNSSTMEHMGVLMVFRIWLNRHAEGSVPDNVSVAPVSKLDILKRIAMRCIGKNKCVLACSIYLSISVFVFVAGSALFQNHVTPLQRAATELVATQTETSPESFSTRQINLPEVYQANHTRYPKGSLAAAMAQCVEQVGLFSEWEVGMMTTELQRRPNLRERWPLVFTHIPKTGGTTVAEGLKQAFRAQGCGVITPRKGKLSIRKGSRHCFGLEVLSGWRLYPWGIFTPEMLQSLPRQSIIGVEGHVPFGICRFFDHLNCSYATLLREPIERYVSHIRWECHLPPFDKPFCNSSIAEYTRAVMRGDIWFYGVDNHQTRMLSGDLSEDSLGLPCFEPGTCKQIGFRKVGRTQLRTAIRNIVFHYPVLGLLEDMDSFSNRLKRIYGYSIKFRHRNKGTFSGMDLNLTAETYKDLQSFLAPDLALYRFVKSILEAKGPRFGTIRHIEK
jgi:hypothetical protein